MYQKILVPLDGSELAECVLPHVENIVKGCGSKTVILIRVVEPIYVTGVMADAGGDYANVLDLKRIETETMSAAKNYLERLLNRIKFDEVNIQAEVLRGQSADRIADYATENKVDLIIIATHGRSGISRWVFGSVADRVLRSSCVPTLMIRAPGCVPGI